MSKMLIPLILSSHQIELEREKMSIERFGKTSLLCGSETEHKEDLKGENLLTEGDFEFKSINEMQSVGPFSMDVDCMWIYAQWNSIFPNQ